MIDYSITASDLSLYNPKTKTGTFSRLINDHHQEVIHFKVAKNDKIEIVDIQLVYETHTINLKKLIQGILQL